MGIDVIAQGTYGDLGRSGSYLPTRYGTYGDLAWFSVEAWIELSCNAATCVTLATDCSQKAEIANDTVSICSLGTDTICETVLQTDMTSAMIIPDADATSTVDTHTNAITQDSVATDLTQECAINVSVHSWVGMIIDTAQAILLKANASQQARN